jgi:hypothetical protein
VWRHDKQKAEVGRSRHGGWVMALDRPHILIKNESISGGALPNVQYASNAVKLVWVLEEDFSLKANI